MNADLEAKLNARADELVGPDREWTEETATQWLDYWTDLQQEQQ